MGVKPADRVAGVDPERRFPGRDGGGVGYPAQRKRQLGEFIAYKNELHWAACLSGLFHYGGNLIHTIASPAVSVAIAWPLGYLSSIWQYFWGVVRGEFKGSRTKTWATLFTGILFFIIALVTLASALYW
jgi:glucose uptake protein GlcU